MPYQLRLHPNIKLNYNINISIMRTLIVLVLIVSPILVASNYTTCVQGIFDYEDAYARMKLNLMDHDFDETADDIAGLASQISTILRQCNQNKKADYLDSFLPPLCFQSLSASSKIIHKINKHNFINSLPSLISTLAQTDLRCPGVDDIVTSIIHKKNPQFNLTFCISESQFMLGDLNKIKNDVKIRQNIAVMTDDIFSILNQIQKYLYACDWQKAQIKYETLLPAKCRDELHQELSIGYRILKHPKKQIKLVPAFIDKIGSILNQCPFLGEEK